MEDIDTSALSVVLYIVALVVIVGGLLLNWGMVTGGIVLVGMFIALVAFICQIKAKV